MTMSLRPLRRSRAEHAVVVDRVAAAYLVRAERHRGVAANRLAVALPADPVSIVVDAAGAAGGEVLGRVAELVVDLARRGTRVVRVVPHEVFPVASSSWWQDLTERTGVELLVPSGGVVVAGTTLFARGAGPGVAGTWWRCAPGGPPRALGPRHPAPAWQPLPGDDGPSVHGSLVTQPVPAGVVLRSAAAPPDPSWLGTPPDPDRPTVFVGTPGGPVVRGEEVAAYLVTLPAPVRASARLVCASAQDAVALGLVVADALGRDVTVVNGVPLVRDEKPEVVLLDDAGAPSWSPYLLEIRCGMAGGAAGVPHRWRAPIPDLVPDEAPGAFRVGDDWLLTMTRGGLWLRQESARGRPLPLGAPVDPSEMTFAVGEPGETLPDGVWTVLPALLDQLEPAVLRRTRLSVLGTPTAAGRGAAAQLAAHRRVPLRLPEAVASPYHGTADERLSAVLGDRYEAHVDAVGPLAEPGPARTDLAALHAYLTERTADLDRALRGDPGTLLPLAVGAASALRRLPSHHGPVHRAAPASAPTRHRPGDVLVEPAPVSATTRPGAGAPAEYLIWSSTARDVGALVDDPGRVVFPPGGRFAVLDVDTTADVPAVLLAELPPTDSGADPVPPGEAEAERLRAALTKHIAPRSNRPWPTWCRGGIGPDAEEEQ
ncbi:hypothetical protein ACIGNX_01520 [Actinosynnema sp. NPDC053489]|uniref:hypothetical protein n=1 Tax=Actinosynnema sp. NPDC053489 TaxID=3363916 RepID=UPI0037C5B182